MKFELDVHWIQRGGKDPVSVLKDYAGLVDLVHLKDYRIGQIPADAFESLRAGDFQAFMGAFEGISVRGDWRGESRLQSDHRSEPDKRGEVPADRAGQPVRPRPV